MSGHTRGATGSRHTDTESGTVLPTVGGGRALPSRCRTLIVGAGLAGLEIARHLEREGATDVLVIDAGPMADPRHVNLAHAPPDALRMWLQADTDPYFHRPWVSRCSPHYTGSSGIRGRFGGRSLYWYGVTLPLESWSLAEPWWPREVVHDLRESWRGGPSLYERATRRLEEWRKAGVTAPSDPVPDTEGVDLGTVRLRHTPVARREGPNGEGTWYAYSALDSWRDPVSGAWLREPVGVGFHHGYRAVNVVVEDGRARGVVVRDTGTGRRTEIAADHVVLCAGTLENSRLALQALNGPGARGPVRLPGLADHIVRGMFLRLEGDEANRLLARVPPGSYVEPCAVARSNLFVDVRAEADGSVLVEIRAMGEQAPNDGSYVECTPAETFPWPVTVHSAPCESDLELLEAQRVLVQNCYEEVSRVIGRAADQLDFGDYDAPIRGNAFALPENIGSLPPGRPATWSNCLGTEDHEGGTLPLGGVIGTDHEFRSVPGLFAAGPSTFPRLGAANPSLTTLALAHRLAARLAEGRGADSDARDDAPRRHGTTTLPPSGGRTPSGRPAAFDQEGVERRRSDGGRESLPTGAVAGGDSTNMSANFRPLADTKEPRP